MTEAEQSSALVNFAKFGAYPEDDGGLAQNLQTSSISSARKSLQLARSNLESDIRSTSRQVAPDVDGWIERAKQLQADIEQSRNIARSVIEEAERAKDSQENSADAAKKAELLKAETKYHNGLREILQKVRSARDQLNKTRSAVTQGDTLEAHTSLQQLESLLPVPGRGSPTNAFELVRQRAEDLRRDVNEQSQELMKKAIHVDRKARRMTIRKRVSVNAGQQVDLKEVIELSTGLGVLRDDLLRLTSDIEHFITGPIFVNGTFEDTTSHIQVSEDTLQLSPTDSCESHNNLVEDLINVLTFLKSDLPGSANGVIGDMLIPPMIAYLISQKVPEALPTSVQDSHSLDAVINQLQQLANTLDRLSWSGASDLQECVRDIPRLWLSKKRESAIDHVRKIIMKSLNSRKNVEHVETQVLSSDDAMVQNHTVPTDDWNEDWGDDNDAEEANKPDLSREQQEEEEDWGGWGADEEESSNAGHVHVNRKQSTKPDPDVDEGAEWDDWDEQKSDRNPRESKAVSDKLRINGHNVPMRSKPVQHEVTLRETYTVTALPDELYDVITNIINDAQLLRTQPYSSSPIASGAMALYSIPIICIAAFRSLAPPAYELLLGGNMLLFNDSNRLVALLKTLQSDAQASSDPVTSRLKLDSDIRALVGFARRNYSKAMDEQRTILSDFVDNAQGFANCTTQPYKTACDDAVSMTIAHLRSTTELWKTILSQNAWLQALGSLLGTVIGKIIVDIEEMSDIGAEESTQLRTYVTEVSKLQELFVRDGQATVGLYVREWFKFQYLAEVLDSNLEDVKFLWREGGLRNEFEVDEVVDLIEALFADSDRRRRAVNEIRHG